MYRIVLSKPTLEWLDVVLQKRAWALFINPHVMSANRVDFGLFVFHKFSNFTPPPLTNSPFYSPNSLSNIVGLAAPSALGDVYVDYSNCMLGGGVQTNMASSENTLFWSN